MKKDKTIGDAFNEEGIEKFIGFANEANLGYLLVSGGGEPFLERSHILKIVEEVESDKIVLVTSANWAKSQTGCETFVQKIYESFKRRKTPTELVIRLSVDLEHQSVGLNPAYYLISLFEEKYLKESNFKLQFHTLFGDPCVEEILKKLQDRILDIKQYKKRSDANTVVKVNPAEKVVTFSSGLILKIGYAKVFHSNLKVDLRNQDIIKRNIDVFMWDLTESENCNPSRVVNMKGENGLDFWVNYNGNVTTWGNQTPDNLYNIYEDIYQNVVEGTFSDPISLYYLENEDSFRDAIINEVNPLAVIRAKATNIRDYTSSILLQEEKTRFYLTLRILQEYIKQKRVLECEITDWPREILTLVNKNKTELIDLYKASDYSIIDQYMNEAEFKEGDWLDLFELIRLGHYDVKPDKIEEGLRFYNCLTKNERISSLDKLKSRPSVSFYQERIIHMKESVAKRFEELSSDV